MNKKTSNKKEAEKNLKLTEGAILPLLVKFMIPIMLSGLLQTLYNAMDSAVVGNFTGPEALAAVGATTSLTNLILALFIGLSTGAGIVVAQLIGAEDKNGVEKAVHTSIALSIAGGIFLTVFGVLFSGKILKLMSTPDEILPLSRTYMVIYFVGAIPSLIYNFGSGILRAAGDSKNPLRFLCVSAVINVVFNLIFVIVFKLGVAGVAISTVISQIISAVLVLRLMLKTNESIRLTPSKISFDKNAFVRIMKIGIPAGIQGAVFSFSNTIIQSTVNSFGKSAVAGCSACAQIEGFVYIIMNSVSVASTTFIGQNFGAEKHKRCEQGFNISLALVSILGLFLGIVLFFGRTLLVRLFTSDAAAIGYGEQRLTVIAISYFLCGLMEVVSGCLRGSGDSFSPMLITLFGVAGSRLLWIFTVLPLKREIFMLYMAFPVSWIITLALLCIRYIVFKRHLNKSQELAA